MGHGHGKYAVNMRMDGNKDVNIYEECEACCTNPQSKLIEKPKTIILQACRSKSNIVSIITVAFLQNATVEYMSESLCAS